MITVENPQGVEKGVKSVTVDGEPVEGNVLPLLTPGAHARVLVRMG